MRKLSAILALALALALPASAFAVTSTGSTTETINGPAATVSLTVPATALYVLGTKYDATIAITNIATNNPNGMHVDMVASNWSGGSNPSAATTRSRDLQVKPAGGSGTWASGTNAARALGFYTGSNPDRLADIIGSPTTASSMSITMHGEVAPFSGVNVAYSGTLAFSAVTD